MSLRHLALLSIFAAAVGAAHAQTVDPWDDPVGRAAIDEWLAQARLTRWGVWEGRTASATCTASIPNPAPDEETRHKAVYRQAQQNKANTNITLAAYVAARMAGQHPTMIYTPKAGHIPR